MSSTQDFIAEKDIFIDAAGKVVEKKDARTKLASKGARVSPADVEKYGLRPTTARKEKPVTDEAESLSPVAEPAPVEKTRAKKGKE